MNNERKLMAANALSVALALAIEAGNEGVTQQIHGGHRIVCMIAIMPSSEEAPSTQESPPESPGSDPYDRGRAALFEIGSWPWPSLNPPVQEMTLK